MQILGRKSRILLVAVAIAMLAALGFSFALWDIAPAKAANADASVYANAKVGDIVTFGRYYQTAGSAELTPIEWIVVDKNERTGQLTLMSKYVLAYGSYFGNKYYNSANESTTKYTMTDANGNMVEKDLNDLVDGENANHSWSESTARAFLNNLERNDLGGDIFNATEGLSKERKPSKVIEVADKTDPNKTIQIGELFSSIGFSHRRHYTGLSYNAPGIVNNKDFEDVSSTIYYRQAFITEPSERLARNGFLDVAFDDNERSMIAPKIITEQNSYRWPGWPSRKITSTTSIDKVWLPSAEELNIREYKDPYASAAHDYLYAGDYRLDTPFEYFKNYKNYNFASIREAYRAETTEFVKQANGLGNFSIPGWIPSSQIGTNTVSSYVTCSAATVSSEQVLSITISDRRFIRTSTNWATLGLRPCINLQY